MDEGPVKRLRLGYHDNLLPVEPNPIRHPVRLATAIGAAVLLVGVVLPWVFYSVDAVTESINGIRGDTWGVYVIAIALGLVAVLSSHWANETPYRPIQLIPAALGLFAIPVVLNVRLEAQQLADSYRANGYQVSFGPGLDVLLVGALVCAAGGVASSAVTWRAYRPRRRTAGRTGAGAPAAAGGPAGAGSDQAGPNRAAASEWQGCADFVAEFAVGVVVCGLCAGLGILAAVAITADTATTPELAVALAIAGVLLGGFATDRLWQRLVRRR